MDGDDGSYSHRIELVDVDDDGTPRQRQQQQNMPSSSSSSSFHQNGYRRSPPKNTSSNSKSSSKKYSPPKDKRPSSSTNKTRGIYSDDMPILGTSSSASRIGSQSWHPRRVAADDTINEWWGTMSQRTRHPTTSGRPETHYGNGASVAGESKRDGIDTNPAAISTALLTDELTMSERASYQNRLSAAEARWAGVGAVYGEVLSLRRQRDDNDHKVEQLEKTITEQSATLRHAKETNKQHAARINELEKQVLEWKLTAQANEQKLTPLHQRIYQLEILVNTKEAETKAEAAMVATQSIALARSQATLAGQSRLGIAHTQLQESCRHLSAQVHDLQRQLAHTKGLLTERDEVVRAQATDLQVLRDRLSVARAREESSVAKAYAADQAVAQGVSVTTQLQHFRSDYEKLLADRMPCGDCKRRQAEHKEEKAKLNQQMRTLEIALRLEDEKRQLNEARRKERERERRASAAMNGSIKAVAVERIEAMLNHQDPETSLWSALVVCPRHIHHNDCPAVAHTVNDPSKPPVMRLCDAYAAAHARAQRGVDLTGCLVFRPVLPRDD